MRDDHEVALLIVGASFGLGADLPHTLALARGCSVDEARRMIDAGEDAARTLDAVMTAGPSIHANRGALGALNMTRVIAAVAGWTEARADAALRVCEHAGYLRLNGKESIPS